MRWSVPVDPTCPCAFAVAVAVIVPWTRKAATVVRCHWCPFPAPIGCTPHRWHPAEFQPLPNAGSQTVKARQSRFGWGRRVKDSWACGRTAPCWPAPRRLERIRAARQPPRYCRVRRLHRSAATGPAANASSLQRHPISKRHARRCVADRRTTGTQSTRGCRGRTAIRKHHTLGRRRRPRRRPEQRLPPTHHPRSVRFAATVPTKTEPKSGPRSVCCDRRA